MRYEVSKTFTFAASHQLSGLPDTHPCSRLHGHNYAVTFTFGVGALSDVGFVVDYRAMSAIKTWLDETFDHRHMNDVVDFNPTAERLAQHIWHHWSTWQPTAQRLTLLSVDVKETDATSARYAP